MFGYICCLPWTQLLPLTFQPEQSDARKLRSRFGNESVTNCRQNGRVKRSNVSRHYLRSISSFTTAPNIMMITALEQSRNQTPARLVHFGGSMPRVWHIFQTKRFLLIICTMWSTSESIEFFFSNATNLIQPVRWEALGPLGPKNENEALRPNFFYAARGAVILSFL